MPTNPPTPPPLSPNWDWAKAQPAEFEFWTRWVDGRYKDVGGYVHAITTLKQAKQAGSYLASNRLCEMREFFEGDVQAWNRFAATLTDLSCLEIGCACEGMVPFWYWSKNRHLIEPLLPQCRKLIEESAPKYGFSKSDTWFTDDITYHAQSAEIPVPHLIGGITGAVVCRNVIDHCANPWLVLTNTLSYCASGCTLFFWSDLWHANGGDAAHRCVTQNPAEVKQFITSAGFDIIRDVGAIHGPGRDPKAIEYGCLAIKK